MPWIILWNKGKDFILSTIVGLKCIALGMCWMYAIHNDEEITFPEEALNVAIKSYIPYKETVAESKVREVMNEAFCDHDIIGWVNGDYDNHINLAVLFILDHTEEMYEWVLN